jgi:hypothetical protein
MHSRVTCLQAQIGAERSVRLTTFAVVMSHLQDLKGTVGQIISYLSGWPRVR